jgi:hypothetical protein
MGRITEAWATIESRENSGVLGTSDYSASSSSSQPSWSVARRKPNKNECEMCGSTPAQRFRLKGNRVFLFSLQRLGYEGVLCKSCALAFGRESMRQTMLFGWWGLWFFLAPFVMAHLGFQLWQINRMPEPQYRDARISSPFDVPIASQSSPFKQPAPLVVLGIVIAYFLFAGFSDSSSTYPSSNTSTTNTPSLCWTAGNVDNNVKNIDCADPSAYYIETLKVTDLLNCPATASNYLKAGENGYYTCLELK